jgi:hypothetical protein
VSALQSAVDEEYYESFALKVQNRDKKKSVSEQTASSREEEVKALEAVSENQAFLASMVSIPFRHRCGLVVYQYGGFQERLPNALSSLLLSIVPDKRIESVQSFLQHHFRESEDNMVQLSTPPATLLACAVGSFHLGATCADWAAPGGPARARSAVAQPQ